MYRVRDRVFPIMTIGRGWPAMRTLACADRPSAATQVAMPSGLMQRSGSRATTAQGPSPNAGTGGNAAAGVPGRPGFAGRRKDSPTATSAARDEGVCMSIVHGDPRADASIAEGIGTGQLRRITRGIYTDEHDQPIGAVCRRQWRRSSPCCIPAPCWSMRQRWPAARWPGTSSSSTSRCPMSPFPACASMSGVARVRGSTTPNSPRGLWRAGPGRIVLDHVRHELGCDRRARPDGCPRPSWCGGWRS